MATLTERYEQAQKDMKKAQDLLKSIFKGSTDQIEAFIGTTERNFSRGNFEIATGELKHPVDEIKNAAYAFEDVLKTWKNVQKMESYLGSKSEDIFEDNLESFEREVGDFLKKQKRARVSLSDNLRAIMDNITVRPLPPEVEQELLKQ